MKVECDLCMTLAARATKVATTVNNKQEIKGGGT